MKTMLITLAGACALLMTGCQNTAALNPQTCSPLGMSRMDLMELKANDFDAKSPDRLALALTDCLGDPDPDIRDGIAYEALTKWLRAESLTPVTIRQLQTDLIKATKSPDETGFRAPFAALVLSEIARVDRVSPFLSDDERHAFVQEAANYVSGVTDYRGFSDDEGWRHGVAHGADWLMQLSLNPNVSDADLQLIREAVATQVSPNGHAYIFGESERLARPILFTAMRGRFSEEDWTEWLDTFADPAPLADWGEAFSSEAGLARVHNTKNFLNALYVNASAGSNPKVKTLLPGVEAALRRLP